MTPDWFRSALDVGATSGTVVVDGARIAFRRWGSPGAGTPVVLLHGGTANTHWWDHVAPRLAETGEIVALDLSGHGDSEWRPEYSARGWAAEVEAVVASLQRGPQAPIVVGHSMGGVVAIELAQRCGERLDSVVVVDSFLAGTTGSPPPSLHVPTLRSGATREEMVDRFRLVPDAPALSFTRRHVAEHAVRCLEGRWHWKFDPRILTTWLLDDLRPAQVGCPVRVVRGERGDMPRESLDRLVELVGPVDRVVTVEAAGHHLMLDRPLELVEALLSEIRNPGNGRVDVRGTPPPPR